MFGNKAGPLSLCIERMIFLMSNLSSSCSGRPFFSSGENIEHTKRITSTRSTTEVKTEENGNGNQGMPLTAVWCGSTAIGEGRDRKDVERQSGWSYNARERQIDG